MAVAELTGREREQAKEASMLVAEKQDGAIKGRMACNRKPTRDWLTKEEVSSPTVGLDSSMFTLVIDAKEQQDVVTADAPNAFVQTKLDQSEGQEKTTMKIAGVLVTHWLLNVHLSVNHMQCMRMERKFHMWKHCKPCAVCL